MPTRDAIFYDANGVEISRQTYEITQDEANKDEFLTTKIDQAMTALTNIINAADVTFSNITQAQTQMRQLQTAIRQEARVLKNILRHLGNNFTDLD